MVGFCSSNKGTVFGPAGPLDRFASVMEHALQTQTVEKRKKQRDRVGETESDRRK